MEKSAIKIGLFGIGLDTYWPQFGGLKERLEGYMLQVHFNGLVPAQLLHHLLQRIINIFFKVFIHGSKCAVYAG